MQFWRDNSNSNALKLERWQGPPNLEPYLFAPLVVQFHGENEESLFIKLV